MPTEFEEAKKAFQDLKEIIKVNKLLTDNKQFLLDKSDFDNNFFRKYAELVDFFDGPGNDDPELIEAKLGECIELNDILSRIIQEVLAHAKATVESRGGPVHTTSTSPQSVVEHPSVRARTLSSSGTRPTSTTVRHASGGAVRGVSTKREPTPKPKSVEVDSSWSPGNVQYAIDWLNSTGLDMNIGTAKELRDFFAAEKHTSTSDADRKEEGRFKSILQIAQIMGKSEASADATISMPEDCRRRITDAHSGMDPKLVSKFVDIAVAESKEAVKRRVEHEHEGFDREDKKLSTIICMDGPPGIGKSSIAHGFAQGLKTKLYPFDCNAKTGRGPIFGYEKTYGSPIHGFYMDAILKTGRRNPLILLDEVPRLGDMAAKDAMMVITDPGVTTVKDDFLKIEIPKEAVFIGTSNDIGSLDPALRDRFVIETLSGYDAAQKFTIIKDKLIPRQIDAAFLDRDLGLLDLGDLDGTVQYLVDEYSSTPGVREHVMNMSSINNQLTTLLLEAQKRVLLDKGTTEDEIAETLDRITKDTILYSKLKKHIDKHGETPDKKRQLSEVKARVEGYNLKNVLRFDRELIGKALGDPRARKAQVLEQIEEKAKDELKERISALEKRIREGAAGGGNVDDLQSELRGLREQLSKGIKAHVEDPEMSRRTPSHERTPSDTHHGRAPHHGEDDTAAGFSFEKPRVPRSSYLGRTGVTPVTLNYELSDIVSQRMHFASESKSNPSIIGMDRAEGNKNLGASWQDIAGNTGNFLDDVNKHKLGSEEWVENAYEVYNGWQVTSQDDSTFTSTYTDGGTEKARIDYTKQNETVNARASLDGFSDPEIADRAIAQMLEVAARIYLETGKKTVKLNGLEDRPDIAVKFMEAAARLAEKDINLKLEFDKPTVDAVLGNEQARERVGIISEIKPGGPGVISNSLGDKIGKAPTPPSHSGRITSRGGM